MTSHALAANAYSGAARTLGTPRDVEYQAFQRVIAMMNAAKDTNAAFTRIAEAVHMNNRLWAALAGDVASTRNGLPRFFAGPIRTSLSIIATHRAIDAQ